MKLATQFVSKCNNVFTLPRLEHKELNNWLEHPVSTIQSNIGTNKNMKEASLKTYKEGPVTISTQVVSYSVEYTRF